MQKSLIIVLAVCLISVHAFVKREAPSAADITNYLEKQYSEVPKKLEDLSKLVSDKLKEPFNADELKKGWEDLSKVLEDFSKTTLGQKQQ